VWRIEIEADSPENAARQAYDDFVRPGGFTHVFEVTTDEPPPSSGGAHSVSMTYTVDIDEGWESGAGGRPATYPMTQIDVGHNAGHGQQTSPDGGVAGDT
jgi:hypothetical protein